jgi:glycerate 2-kinase
MDRRGAHELLRSWFGAAVGAADPAAAVAGTLSLPAGPERATVLALGKAAPAMCRGAARAIGNISGIAVSNHEDEVPDGIELFVGGHPVPDERSMRAGEALLEAAGRLDAGDIAIVLVSGGGSALAEVPVVGLTIEDLACTNGLLLRSGADIHQTNVVRRRLSRLKGGGLARAIDPARLVTLAVSDVVGDDPAVIASGPTVAAHDAPEAAIETVRALGVEDDLPDSVRAALLNPVPDEAPAPAQEFKIVAGGSVAAHAAAAAAQRDGYPATVVDTRLIGDAGLAAGETLERSRGSVSVFAGETTVTVTGHGVGGRNQEAALVAATILDGRPDTYFLAAGTDGIDGTTHAAGAIVDGTTLTRARALGLSPEHALDHNDSGTFFAELGDQVITGPTGTNVGDIWLVLHAG